MIYTHTFNTSLNTARRENETTPVSQTPLASSFAKSPGRSLSGLFSAGVHPAGAPLLSQRMSHVGDRVRFLSTAVTASQGETMTHREAVQISPALVEEYYQKLSAFPEASQANFIEVFGAQFHDHKLIPSQDGPRRKRNHVAMAILSAVNDAEHMGWLNTLITTAVAQRMLPIASVSEKAKQRLSSLAIAQMAYLLQLDPSRQDLVQEFLQDKAQGRLAPDGLRIKKVPDLEGAKYYQEALIAFLKKQNPQANTSWLEDVFDNLTPITTSAAVQA